MNKTVIAPAYYHIHHEDEDSTFHRTENFMFRKGRQLSLMLVIAAEQHCCQYDKQGRAYILHPLNVMHMLNTDDEELQCIALGHDLIEDCRVTCEQLREVGFSDRIVNGIRCLTKVGGESYEEYKAKVKSCKDSVLVKMQDLLHNSDLSRIKSVTEKDIQRTLKYIEFYEELLEFKTKNGW